MAVWILFLSSSEVLKNKKINSSYVFLQNKDEIILKYNTISNHIETWIISHVYVCIQIWIFYDLIVLLIFKLKQYLQLKILNDYL